MINQILTEIALYDKNIKYDTETIYHNYRIKYQDAYIILEVAETHIYMNEDGKYKYKTNINTIKKLKCNMKEFAYFLTEFYEAKMEVEQYNKTSYENGLILEKIRIYQL